MPPETVPPEFAPFLEDFVVRAEQVRALTLKWPFRIRKVYDAGIAAIDRRQVLSLQRWIREDVASQYSADPSKVNLRQMPYKYMDLPATIKDKATLLVAAGVDWAPKGRILDIGVGGGALAHLCTCFGHEVVGLDIPDPVYSRLLDLVDISFVPGKVAPGTALPVEGRFNLIFATQIVFNKMPADSSVGPNDTYWSYADWIFFFRNLTDHLEDGGRIFMSLNRQPHYRSEISEADWILDWLTDSGCRTNYSQYTIDMTKQQALNLSPYQP